MALDAWLPVGFSLPDGSKTKTVIHRGGDWQIVSMQGRGRALIAREALARRWIDGGLIEAERFGRLGFAPDVLLAVSFASNSMVAPVNECRSPYTKAEALAFAAALKATRAIDGDSPLHDAIYVEPLSRLLPVYSSGARMEDGMVLGYWLTGGAPIPVKSFGRLCQVLSWMPPQGVRDVIAAAGLEEDESASLEGAKDGRGPGRRSKPPFELPGRRALEAFLREHVISVVENRARYQALGVGFPGAIVLHGPPGCGKTFAVDRLVEHLGWPCFRIEAASVASPYIHETSRKVAGVFDAAADAAPSVLVIDEMEAFLAERDAWNGQHRVEEVAEFLRRIPEAPGKEVLVVAMTNRLDMIDPAILRRGRFDYIVEVGPASQAEVEALLTALLARLPKEDGVDTAALANRLSDSPLSDVAFVVREAARLTARDGRDRISQDALEAALKAAPPRARSFSRRIGFL